MKIGKLPVNFPARRLLRYCAPKFGADEALSTRCRGQGVTTFYGMAKPVRAPQIGPAREVTVTVYAISLASSRRSTIK